MPDGLRCGGCGEPVPDESPSADPSQRKPCPKCGAVARAYDMAANLRLAIGGSATFAASTVSTWPSVLLRAVVEFGDKAPEGQLIQAVAPPWFEIAKLIGRDPSLLYRINPRRWEELIAGWYKAYGFDEVILTPRAGDFGRDVIAVKRGVLCVRIIDQVKAYSPDHPVPANDVRALLGVLNTDRAATKGLVTTTSDFAPKIREGPFIAPYVPHRLELVNGTELVRRLAEVAKRG